MGTMEDDDDFLNNDNFGVRSEEKYISITATATVRLFQHGQKLVQEVLQNIKEDGLLMMYWMKMHLI